MKLGRIAPNYTMMERNLLDIAPPEIATKAMLLGVKLEAGLEMPPPGDSYVCKDRMVLGVDGDGGDKRSNPKGFKTPEEALSAAVNPHKDGLVWL